MSHPHPDPPPSRGREIRPLGLVSLPPCGGGTGWGDGTGSICVWPHRASSGMHVLRVVLAGPPPAARRRSTPPATDGSPAAGESRVRWRVRRLDNFENVSHSEIAPAAGSGRPETTRALDRSRVSAQFWKPCPRKLEYPDNHRVRLRGPGGSGVGCRPRPKLRLGPTQRAE